MTHVHDCPDKDVKTQVTETDQTRHLPDTRPTPQCKFNATSGHMTGGHTTYYYTAGVHVMWRLLCRSEDRTPAPPEAHKSTNVKRSVVCELYTIKQSKVQRPSVPQPTCHALLECRTLAARGAVVSMSARCRSVSPCPRYRNVRTHSDRMIALLFAPSALNHATSSRSLRPSKAIEKGCFKIGACSSSLTTSGSPRVAHHEGSPASSGGRSRPSPPPAPASSCPWSASSRSSSLTKLNRPSIAHSLSMLAP